MDLISYGINHYMHLIIIYDQLEFSNYSINIYGYFNIENYFTSIEIHNFNSKHTNLF